MYFLYGIYIHTVRSPPMDDPWGNRKPSRSKFQIYIFSIVKTIKEMSLESSAGCRSQRVLPSTGGSGQCVRSARTPSTPWSSSSGNGASSFSQSVQKKYKSSAKMACTDKYKILAKIAFKIDIAKRFGNSK